MVGAQDGCWRMLETEAAISDTSIPKTRKDPFTDCNETTSKEQSGYTGALRRSRGSAVGLDLYHLLLSRHMNISVFSFVQHSLEKSWTSHEDGLLYQWDTSAEVFQWVFCNSSRSLIGLSCTSCEAARNNVSSVFKSNSCGMNNAAVRPTSRNVGLRWSSHFAFAFTRPPTAVSKS